MVRRTLESLSDEDPHGLQLTTARRRGSERVRGTAENVRKRARILRGRTEEACCSCTRHSTCSTDKCECRAAGVTCRQCVCQLNCSNQPCCPLPVTMERTDEDDVSGDGDGTAFGGADMTSPSPMPTGDDDGDTPAAPPGCLTHPVLHHPLVLPSTA